ncbi:MAG: hemolysin family protein [Phycisphaerae bacterium]
MQTQIIFLFVFALLALAVSFLCSMLEASLLSIPASHVAMLVEQGSAVGKKLQRMKAQVDRPLSAILTLNTVAHTVGAAGVGAESAIIFGEAWVGLASAIMTILILVLSEIIPKTLGAVHARKLTGFTVWATRIMMIVTWPIVIMLEWVNRLVGHKRQKEPLSRAELVAAVHLGRQAGAVDAQEFKTLRNLMSLGQVKVSDILTPRTVLSALPEDQTVRQVMDGDATLRYARIPVYRGSIDNVTGYATRFEITEAFRAGRAGAELSELARPIKPVPEQASVSDALNQMLAEHEHILLVVDEYGGVEGIVTLEDAVETMLGLEIIDEADEAPDLQEVARELARRRAERARR